jgi:hypothetical protein
MANVSSFLSDRKEYMADQHKPVSDADTFYRSSGHGTVLRCAFNHIACCLDKMTMIYVLHVDMPVFFFYGLSLLVITMS